MYNPFSLNGKTVLVTGASSGIGRSIAVECSRMGASVVLTGRNMERLNVTLDLMGRGNHMVLPADLLNESDIVKLVDELPVLDGIVHNAGVGNRVICKAVKVHDINFSFKPNFYGPVLLQRYLLKKKKVNREASIVFIASRAPFAPSVGNSIYAASKGAILGYAKVLALEVAPQKIRVNSICPAMVWTDLVEKDALAMGADYHELQMKYPLKRYGKPEDVAYLTIYLLSDASCWMTGNAIDLTGGGEGILTL
ncbi:SDR family oxidoreductase [Bacteroides sp. GD17]|jgi:NAD(P)-dependent dehydrogenase (short-subunit alcohol dehydrogenase family)|uniref:SDR family NAD(P)-dependent oxidoreductase n=1 Tax=Bacteroides sp. GD17 TaxID=3139826 RepID=UPI0025F6EB34|nr:SDR family oxidoreductase [uncultured Bacteroides sp.]